MKLGYEYIITNTVMHSKSHYNYFYKFLTIINRQGNVYLLALAFLAHLARSYENPKTLYNIIIIVIKYNIIITGKLMGRI